jgi:hydrogenase maturation factor
MNNTGVKIYRWLKEIDVNTGLPTGARKPNLPNDPDYVAPVVDLDNCPIDRKFFALRWNDQDAPINQFADRSYIFDNSLNTTAQKRSGIYNFSIKVDVAGIKDIVQLNIYSSEDQGESWQLISSGVQQSIADNITFNSTHKQYKSEIALQDGTTMYSNVLKITRNYIDIGQIVLVHNNIEYNPLNHNVDINLTSDTTILFKNKSVNQIVQLADIKVSKDTGLAVAITNEKGYLAPESTYDTKPQIQQWIQPNNGWIPLVIKQLKPGNYVLRLAVVDPNNNTTRLYMYNWYITVQS